MDCDRRDATHRRADFGLRTGEERLRYFLSNTKVTATVNYFVSMKRFCR